MLHETVQKDILIRHLRQWAYIFECLNYSKKYEMVEIINHCCVSKPQGLIFCKASNFFSNVTYILEKSAVSKLILMKAELGRFYALMKKVMT